MGKVKDQEIKGNKNRGQSTAMARPGGGGGEGGRLQAAIAKLQARIQSGQQVEAQVIEQQGNVVRDKDKLCGVDFYIVDVNGPKVSPVHGTLMIVVRAIIASSGDLVVFTDGSTGVMGELEDFTKGWTNKPTPESPFLVKGGLNKSTYDRKKYNPNWNGKDPETKYLKDEAGEFVYETNPQTGARLKGTTYHLSGEADLSKVRGLNTSGVANGKQLRA